MKFGQQLIRAGVITEVQLKLALKRQRSSRRLLGETLLELGCIREVDFLSLLAGHFGIPYVRTDQLFCLSVPQDVLDLVPARLVKEHTLIPVQMHEDKQTLIVLGCEPQNTQGILEARVISGVERVVFFLARREVVWHLIEQHYGEPEEVLLRLEVALPLSP